MPGVHVSNDIVKADTDHHVDAFTKRALDIIGSLAALLLLSPVLVVVACLVRLKLGSPIFFVQLRPGLYGRSFYIYKFRTMYEKHDKQGHLLPDHVRLTRLGSFLRKSSIDELPELFNVLKGDMSLVGPRPLLMEYLPFYTEEERRRHNIRPGITGWAQIHGRNHIPWDERLALDVWYVDNRSTKLDIQILLRTVVKVIMHDGVAVDTDTVETNLHEERCHMDAGVQ